MHYMLGLAYCDVYGGTRAGGHLHLSHAAKGAGCHRCLTNLVIFMPVMVLMTIASWKYALTSIAGRELNPTSWAPPIYPIKTLMAISFSFLLIQGFSNLIITSGCCKAKRKG
jgi:TRAP-type mannitol/chloroaromatic compound transport system permease small subunit